ncbi:MAG: response regulator transcription factor [Nitrospirota bacterium]
MFKILIADSHEVSRLGLRQLLSHEPDLTVAAEALTAQDLLKLAAKQDLDAVVLDLNLGNKGGLDLLKELRRVRPDLPVLVFTGHPEQQYGLRAIKAGARGYVSKARPAKEIVKALRTVCSGGNSVSELLADRLAMERRAGAYEHLHDGLSNREFEVLLLIASGYTVTEIARRLALSVKTVSTHRTRILEKMGMKRNQELIRYAFSQGLVN